MSLEVAEGMWGRASTAGYPSHSRLPALTKPLCNFLSQTQLQHFSPMGPWAGISSSRGHTCCSSEDHGPIDQTQNPPPTSALGKRLQWRYVCRDVLRQPLK